MQPSFSALYLLLLAEAVVVVAAADAFVRGAWDLFVMVLMIGLLLAALVAQAVGRRVPLRVRADLAAWLRGQAQLTGQPMEHLADRAIALYRSRVDSPWDPAPASRGGDRAGPA